MYTHKTNTINTSCTNDIINTSCIDDTHNWALLNSKLNRNISIKNNHMELNINEMGVFSNINDGKNFLIMVETIKQILISKNIVTKEEFNKIYKTIEKNIEDKIECKKVLDELTKEENNKHESVTINQYIPPSIRY